MPVDSACTPLSKYKPHPCTQNLLIRPRGRRASGWSQACLCPPVIPETWRNRRTRRCHGSDDTVSDSVLSLSVFMSLLMCVRTRGSASTDPLLVWLNPRPNGARHGCECVSLTGRGVTLIDYLAGSSTACLAVLPRTALHLTPGYCDINVAL